MRMLVVYVVLRRRRRGRTRGEMSGEMNVSVTGRGWRWVGERARAYGTGRSWQSERQQVAP